ncbi:MAG: efflux RND transporter periplasmic adaptor subunit [Deltaproteobacteria bacterium]|nr:efflux RND transporter periplasmic adaptor subunit [Deltaproteobacteria bacterium]
MRRSVLTAALGAWCACSAWGDKAPPKFETVVVDKGRVSARVTASGTLAALVTVQVGTQVSGRLHEIKVDFNDVVKKGQVIARIDPRLFEAALEQARANLQAAEGNLQRAEVEAAEARRKRDRLQEMGAAGARYDVEAATAVADGAQANVSAVKGQVAQSRANVKQAELNLSYTVIHAPIDGIVISRAVDVGQTVAASFQSPTLFTIAEDLRKMQVETAVSEADIGRLSAGMEATFTVDAWPGRRFQGRVRQIRNAPINVQNVVTYTVVMDVENPDLALKPGMTATANFTYAEREGVLRVPNAALRFRPSPEVLARLNPDGGRPEGAHPETSRRPVAERSPDKRTVWVLRDGTPVAVPVKVGITDGTTTELVEGEVHEGDKLVTDIIFKDPKSNALPGGSPVPGGPGRRML